jgi:hypothetical protein
VLVAALALGRDALAGDDAQLLVEDRALDLGPAEIDAEAQG